LKLLDSIEKQDKNEDAYGLNYHMN